MRFLRLSVVCVLFGLCSATLDAHEPPPPKVVYCVPSDGHGGSVVFVVRGDGKDLFRSEKITDRKSRETTVDIAGIETLELIVKDAGNGNSDDWEVWTAPTLER